MTPSDNAPDIIDLRPRALPFVHPQGKTASEAARFAVVIPCFNERDSILQTLTKLRATLRGAGPYELIVVDDGSRDGTAERLAEAARDDPTLRLINHRENQGYGASIKTGVRHATAEYIVIIDADGTYPADRVPELVDMAHEVDMVVGARTGRAAHHPWLRRIPKAFLRRYASWICGVKIPDLNSGLRVFRRDVVMRFFFMISDGFSFTTTTTLVMLTNHFTVRYVPIDYAPRVGRSKIKPIRDTLNFIHLILRAGIQFAPMRTLFPFAPLSLAAFLASLTYDVAVLRNLTDKTMLLFTLTVYVFLLALLADAIGLMTKKVALDGMQERDLAEKRSSQHVTRTIPVMADTETPDGQPTRTQSWPAKAA
jgi:glycosyltransferase involved in cell wall biosynthesis